MKAEILCSSRELFGADRCALRLAEVLRSIGIEPCLVVPSHRPERGLRGEAVARGIPYYERQIAIATSKGVERPLAVLPRTHRTDVAVTIFNSTAVIGAPGDVRQKVVIVREWLLPQLLRHRALTLRHRVGVDAVVGISSDVITQWRSCVRGPKRQFLVNDWLERDYLDRARASLSREADAEERAGILCIGRFNNWKGQEVLADAYERAFSVTAERPPLRFVGAQEDAQFAGRANAVRARGAAWGWEVLPFTAEPANYFRKAALVVVPSLNPEPFGMVILEALAHGCRVLAFEGGGPSDVAPDFPQAVKTIRRDIDCLAGALADWWSEGGRALSSDELRQVWRALDRHYSPEVRATTWKKIVEAIT